MSLTSQQGNPDKARFVFVYHQRELALPGIRGSARPGWWEAVDRMAYVGDRPDVWGFVRGDFRTKAEAKVWVMSRYENKMKAVTKSILTLNW